MQSKGVHMERVKIQLFNGFQIIADGRELPFAPSAKETLALLTVAGGKRVTAKALWQILYNYKKIRYNGTLYTKRINDMKSELEVFQMSEIICKDTATVRFCRIKRDAIACDYYDMLDGKLPFGDEKDFLPEYEWAKAFYWHGWHELYQYWDSLHC